MKKIAVVLMAVLSMACAGCGDSGTSATPDAATTITAPVLSSITTGTINVTPGTFSDTDGVQQVVVALYNATRTTRLATAANGQFSGLAAATAYSLRMEGQAKNGTSGLFEDKTSGWTDVVTDSNVVPAPEVVDAETVITAPALESRTATTINMTPGTFSDADGVQNVVVAIYDYAKITRIGIKADGKFTGLFLGNVYSFRMEGQARNKITGLFEDKASEWKNVATLDQ